jgi:hypothetical protein
LEKPRFEKQTNSGGKQKAQERAMLQWERKSSARKDWGKREAAIHAMLPGEHRKSEGHRTFTGPCAGLERLRESGELSPFLLCGGGEGVLYIEGC